jgi:hypothetical protein
MNKPEELLWNRVADASRPNAAEMAAAEAELRALDGAEPLPGDLVDSVLERATAPVTTLRLVEPSRSGWKRMMLLAALLLMSVSGIAWFAITRTTVEKQVSTTLDYAEAVQLATEPGRQEDARVQAVLKLEAYCGYAADALRRLSTGSNQRLAGEAAKIRSDIASLLANGPLSRPSAVDAAFEELIASIENERLPLETRLAILPRLADQLASGVAAFLLAGPLLSANARGNHEIALTHLKRDYSN